MWTLQVASDSNLSSPRLVTSYLSTVNPRWNSSFDSTIIRGIHPEKKFPASRKGNCQRMEDLFRVDAKKKQDRNRLNEINSLPLLLYFPFFFIICSPSTFLKMNLKWIHILSSLRLSRENDWCGHYGEQYGGSLKN